VLRLNIADPLELEAGFDAIRTELDIPGRFSKEVLAEAAEATVDSGLPDAANRVDATNVAFVAIDPPGSTDLDQAFAARRVGDGYQVSYAIADVAAFVRPGGAIDREARERGSTMYLPDGRAPLHPAIVSEDRASLLADTAKPALLWTIDLDGYANPTDWRLERANVRVRAAISYATAQAIIDRTAKPGPGVDIEICDLLAEIGRLRQAREAQRGGVSLKIPAQEIEKIDGSYQLRFDETLPVEEWNAQISLLTGMVAGRTMVGSGIGIVRTLPPALDRDIDRLRRTAQGLGLNWPTSVSYADYVREMRPTEPETMAFLLQATRTLRGAGYVGFNGEVPEHPEHSAIASVYSHVTAPLRRLVDRFGNEILLSHFAGRTPPAWALEALDELPSMMGRARQRESSLERALLDMSEALTLQSYIGDNFDALVVDVRADRNEARIQIAKPAIVAKIAANGLELADTVSVCLKSVDVKARRLSFEAVES